LIPLESFPANNTGAAAVERVPQIKPEDVEEVFFGNVLSAKYEPFRTRRLIYDF
jgi:acetyl-CoA acetyltransferase